MGIKKITVQEHVHEFVKKYSRIRKMFVISKNVHDFKKRLRFQKKFMISKNIHDFRKCLQFQKMFANSEKCSQICKKNHEFTNISKQLDMNLRNVQDFDKTLFEFENIFMF